MAHKRKDTLVATGEWAKHLHPYNKRVMAKAERRAAKHFILVSVNELGEIVDKHGNRWIPAE